MVGQMEATCLYRCFWDLLHCGITANMGKPPLPTFVLQLEETRSEWKRRHPYGIDELGSATDKALACARYPGQRYFRSSIGA